MVDCQVVADESVDFRLIYALRDRGAEVYSIRELHPSITDEIVLQIANKQQRLLITEDKDFGELVFRTQQPHFGVLLLRLSEKSPQEFPMIANLIINNYESLQYAFAVYNGSKLRIKK